MFGPFDTRTGLMLFNNEVYYAGPLLLCLGEMGRLRYFCGMLSIK